MTDREKIIARAIHIHDNSGCQCDPKYVMSCFKMVDAIFQAGREIREEET